VNWLSVSISFAAGAVLFVAPHRRTMPSEHSSFAGTAKALLAREAEPQPGRAVLMSCVLFAGSLTPFWPAACLLVAQLVAPPDRSTALAWSAVLLAAGTVLALFLIIVSNLSFGCGQSSMRDATPLAAVIPAWVGASALLALAGAIWGGATGWLLG